MITKEALSNKYANKEQELCLYEFVVVIVLYYGFIETLCRISSQAKNILIVSSDIRFIKFL